MTKASVSPREWAKYKAYHREYQRAYRESKRRVAGVAMEPRILGPWQRRCSCGAIFVTDDLAETACAACQP